MKTCAKTFLLTVFLLPATPYCFAADDNKGKDIPLFYLLAPGGTHFYEGDVKEGLSFAAPTGVY